MSSQEEVAIESGGGVDRDNGLYNPKEKPKLVRILTVVAYMLSVSMAAILLSSYYIFMWDGRPHLGAQTAPEPQKLIANPDLHVNHDIINEPTVETTKETETPLNFTTTTDEFFTENFTEKMTMPEVPTVKYEETTFTPQQNVNVSTETAEELQQYNYSRENNFIKKLIAM